MDPIVHFLRDDTLPEGRLEAEKIWRNAPRFWLSEAAGYTDAHILGRTYYVYTQRNPSPCWKSYMRGFVEVTQEGDHWRTGLSPKDIGGRTCKERPKNMQRSVINARDSRQISTNQEESLTPPPAPGRLLSGVLILLVLSLKQQGISDT